MELLVNESNSYDLLGVPVIVHNVIRDFPVHTYLPNSWASWIQVELEQDLFTISHHLILLGTVLMT